jgi:hypothetical protein
MSSQQTEWRQLLKADQAEQTAWINSHLRAGMPPDDVFAMLILNKSEIALPLIEQKIEEVLRSQSPLECFTDKSVDPQNFVHLAALSIMEAGNVESLRQASKLIKIDEKQFGWMVERTLIQARTYRNPFVVAYQGLAIGDPAIDSRIAAWAEVELAEKRPPQRNYGPRDPEPIPESAIREVRQWWAEAMADRYGGVLTERDWTEDPIVSRLQPTQMRALHDPVFRAASEAVQKKSKQ